MAAPRPPCGDLVLVTCDDKCQTQMPSMTKEVASLTCVTPGKFYPFLLHFPMDTLLFNDTDAIKDNWLQKVKLVAHVGFATLKHGTVCLPSVP